MKKLKGFTVLENKVTLRWAKKIILVRENGERCKLCGEDNIYVLEFHHEEDQKKDFSISKAIQDLSLDQLRKECSKCVLLYSNCHQKVHALNGRGLRDKAIIFKNLSIGVTCEKCKKDFSLCCLSFHHINQDTKIFDVSRYWQLHGVARGATYEQFNEEIKKCILLCRNCHSIEHINFERMEKLKEYIQHKIENYVAKSKNVNVEEIKRLYNDGKYGRQIARELGLSNSAVSHKLKKLGLTEHQGEKGFVTLWKNKKQK
jgi:hypothetical protein